MKQHFLAYQYHNFLAYQEQQQHPTDHGLAYQEQNTDQGIGTVLICLSERSDYDQCIRTALLIRNNIVQNKV